MGCSGGRGSQNRTRKPVGRLLLRDHGHIGYLGRVVLRGYCTVSIQTKLEFGNGQIRQSRLLLGTRYVLPKS